MIIILLYKTLKVPQLIFFSLLSYLDLMGQLVACESLWTPCRICENVNNFN